MSTMLRKLFFGLPRQPLHINLYVLVLALILYLFGFGAPLVLSAIAGLVLFMPMPRVFTSWFSRISVAVLMLLSLIQVAAVVQFLGFPHSNFKVLASILTICAILVLLLFGSKKPIAGMKVVRLRDVAALAGCALFVLPFAVTMFGHDPLLYISRMTASQITDGVVHWHFLTIFASHQHLEYQPGMYYPAGFHIATSFIEHGIQPKIVTLSWAAHAWTYFLQYMALGSLLCYVVIYFVYGLCDFLKVHLSRFAVIVSGIVVGACLTLMSLLIFVQDGFLNYFYICAAIIVGLLFLFEIEREPLAGNGWQRYTWPLTAYLLLGAGVSLSWPMFAPLFLVVAACVALPTVRAKTWHSWQYLRLHIPAAVAGVIVVLSLYFQMIYSSGQQNASLIYADGALRNLNIPLLLVGLAGLSVLVYAPYFARQRDRLLVALIPYVALVGGLMMLHVFKIGTVHYYAAKCGLILEMLLLAILVVVVMYFCGKYARMAAGSVVYAAVLVGAIVAGTVCMLPQPLTEIRTLFRFQILAPPPPHIGEDSATITKLGRQNKLQASNLTILHYNAVTDQLFAQAGGASWANAMGKQVPTQQARDTDNWFSVQFKLLSYGSGAQDQIGIIEAVKGSIQSATRDGGKYYIVTDAASVDKLKELFGTRPTYVVK